MEEMIQEIKEKVVHYMQDSSEYTETVRWAEMLKNVSALQAKWHREDKKSA